MRKTRNAQYLLDEKVLKLLEKESKKSGVFKSRIVENALLEYLKRTP